MSALPPKADINCRHVAHTSVSRFAISAHGPHIRFALRYGLVHALTSARVRNSAPGEVGPLSTCRASAAALVACSLQREEVRVGSTPLIMASAILVEHHSKTNAGTFITAVTKLVQPLALTGHSVLRLNRQGAKHKDAGDSCCHSDLDVHDCLPCPKSRCASLSAAGANRSGPTSIWERSGPGCCPRPSA